MSEPNAYERLLEAQDISNKALLVLAPDQPIALVRIMTRGDYCELRFRMHDGAVPVDVACVPHLCEVINDRMEELKSAAIELAHFHYQQAKRAAQEELGPVCDMVPRGRDCKLAPDVTAHHGCDGPVTAFIRDEPDDTDTGVGIC